MVQFLYGSPIQRLICMPCNGVMSTLAENGFVMPMTEEFWQKIVPFCRTMLAPVQQSFGTTLFQLTPSQY